MTMRQRVAVRRTVDSTNVLGVIAEIGHWITLWIILGACVYLASTKALLHSDVTAIMGAVIGHAGTYISMRRTDY